LSKSGKTIATVVVPFFAFGVVLLVNHIYGNNINDLLPYAIVIAIGVAAFLFGQQKPVKTLLTLSLLAAFAMVFGVLSHGIVSVYAFISGGLCCSIMWPCIFSLGVAGLGKYTSQGSAFLIMMILGAAVIPPLQGSIGDIHTSGGGNNMHNSYLIAAACFGALAFLALRFKSVLKAQGLNFDEQIGGGH
jgi:FHS family L-fucose permease-like MFS transporter